MGQDLRELLPSWRLSLSAERKAKATIRTYTHGVEVFFKWCDEVGERPVLEKALVQRWTTELLEAGAQATTARAHQHAVRMFAKWMVDEGEIDANPLEGLRLPRLDAKVVHALTDADVRAIIAACKGKKLVDVRDEAIVRLMAETGLRAGEVVSLHVGDVDLVGLQVVVQRGKGGKGRVAPFSASCGKAIDRYLRTRRRLGVPEGGLLWVGGVKGGKPLNYPGMRASLKMRADLAGVKDFHPHLFRHTAATRWLRAGGSEAGLMAVAGWRSRDMIDRYTGASAMERAAEESRRLGLEF